ncbi:hypothetical protein LEP1GSC161_2785 [Leptospira santarosai str. CBC1416]|uniref:Uncharacterized protein n=1 Tax=Leptospira santarosai str. CBC1416 TaxID=1193059 RepID=M6VNT4_9LEPT|nr:hypothetical protein LEP1GSC161_2785 [Leptospira santarosai str. CBC1416]
MSSRKSRDSEFFYFPFGCNKTKIESVSVKKRIFKFNEIVYNFLTYFLLKRNKNKIESGDTISWAKRAPNTTIPS